MAGRFAYVVLAHHRLHQVRRLVDRLTSGRARFFIHVDARTPRDALVVLGPLHGRADVVLLKRHASPWGRFGLVLAALEGIRAAVADPDVERVTLLSGQDYPIKPVGHIEAFFDAAPDVAFVEHHRLPRADWPGRGGAQRYEDLHWWMGRHQVTVPLGRVGLPRRLPKGREPFQGGQYFSLDRESAAAVLDAADARVQRFFSRTSVPDEMFFQTVLMNTDVAPRVRNDDLRLEVWTGGSHPKVLTIEDLPLAVASDRLFAKKFDDGVDGRILDAIDREILLV